MNSASGGTWLVLCSPFHFFKYHWKDQTCTFFSCTNHCAMRQSGFFHCLTVGISLQRKGWWELGGKGGGGFQQHNHLQQLTPEQRFAISRNVIGNRLIRTSVGPSCRSHYSQMMTYDFSWMVSLKRATGTWRKALVKRLILICMHTMCLADDLSRPPLRSYRSNSSSCTEKMFVWV